MTLKLHPCLNQSTLYRQARFLTDCPITELLARSFFLVCFTLTHNTMARLGSFTLTFLAMGLVSTQVTKQEMHTTPLYSINNKYFFYIIRYDDDNISLVSQTNVSLSICDLKPFKWRRGRLNLGAWLNLRSFACKVGSLSPSLEISSYFDSKKTEGFFFPPNSLYNLLIINK